MTALPPYITAAIRAAGTAASAALDWFAPLRLATINESTDRLWATRSREELLATHDERVQALSADLKQQSRDYAAQTAVPPQLYPRAPRVIQFRGLDARERDTEWIDAQGDRWRWYAEEDGAAKSWHYLWMPGLPVEKWVEADPTAAWAPYIEAGSAARTDESGPAAEDSPAPAVLAPAGAGVRSDRRRASRRRARRA